jgi:hypothetical protein
VWAAVWEEDWNQQAFLSLHWEQRGTGAHSHLGPSEGCRDFAGPLARQGASPRASLLLLGCGRRALSPANWTRPSRSSGQARARRLRCSCTLSMQNTGTSERLNTVPSHVRVDPVPVDPVRGDAVQCSLSLLHPPPYCARSLPCLDAARPTCPRPQHPLLCSSGCSRRMHPGTAALSLLPTSNLRSTSRYAEPATQRVHRLTRCDTTRAHEPGEGRTARAPGRSLSSAARLIHWTREPYCRVAEVSAYQVRSTFTRPTVAMLLTDPARIPPQSEHSNCTRPDAGGTL